MLTTEQALQINAMLNKIDERGLLNDCFEVITKKIAAEVEKEFPDMAPDVCLAIAVEIVGDCIRQSDDARNAVQEN